MSRPLPITDHTRELEALRSQLATLVLSIANAESIVEFDYPRGYTAASVEAMRDRLKTVQDWFDTTPPHLRATHSRSSSKTCGIGSGSSTTPVDVEAPCQADRGAARRGKRAGGGLRCWSALRDFFAHGWERARRELHYLTCCACSGCTSSFARGMIRKTAPCHTTTADGGTTRSSPKRSTWRLCRARGRASARLRVGAGNAGAGRRRSGSDAPSKRTCVARAIGLALQT